RTDTDAESETAQRRHRSREKFRVRLRSGEMEDAVIELSVEEKATPVGMFATIGSDQLGPDVQSLLEQIMPSQSKPRQVPVREARKIVFEQECDKLIDRQKVNELAIQRAENSGIIFIDEIDKVCSPASGTGPDISRQGVQRDLLPIVEGTTVSTRIGPVKTDHVLCIAAGAFHSCKPSDLMPELQGRFPIRVELQELTADDFRRILTEPEGALVKQQIALMATEGVTITFTDEAVSALADLSYRANQNTQNIGARRLHAAVEKLMETISFDAPELSGQTIAIDEAYVRERLAKIADDESAIHFGFHSLQRED
ncbi:MAG: HslU--HslV peptidase ATPase subunit, partial [Planctomycetes bacterium]|nr:HslU--HslV peptidase ATPase subunit [Planctomycetota bacterium]